MTEPERLPVTAREMPLNSEPKMPPPTQTMAAAMCRKTTNVYMPTRNVVELAGVIDGGDYEAQFTQRVVAGRASSRSTGISPPQFSQVP